MPFSSVIAWSSSIRRVLFVRRRAVVDAQVAYVALAHGASACFEAAQLGRGRVGRCGATVWRAGPPVTTVWHVPDILTRFLLALDGVMGRQTTATLTAMDGAVGPDMAARLLGLVRRIAEIERRLTRSRVASS